MQQSLKVTLERLCQISVMELFRKKIYHQKLLTIFAKSSLIVVLEGPKYASDFGLTKVNTKYITVLVHIVDSVFMRKHASQRNQH